MQCRLADHDATGRLQPRDDGGIRVRHAALEEVRAAGGLEAGGVDVVLDGKRHAGQQARPRARAAALVEVVRSLARAIAIDRHHGVDVIVPGVELLDRPFDLGPGGTPRLLVIRHGALFLSVVLNAAGDAKHRNTDCCMALCRVQLRARACPPGRRSEAR